MTGYRLYMDGNAWCAVPPHFQDLMQSPSGFGETMEDAVAELNQHIGFRHTFGTFRPIRAVIENFSVRCPRCEAELDYGSEPDDCRDFHCPAQELFR